jgi:hypothetical protein
MKVRIHKFWNKLVKRRSTLKPSWWYQNNGRFECWAVEETKTGKLVAGPFNAYEWARIAVDFLQTTWGKTHRVVYMREARNEEL